MTVATQKNETFRAAKLLVVQTIKSDGQADASREMLALDPGLGAGTGDVVLVARQGQVVHQIMNDDSVPANVIVVGIVDDWEVTDAQSTS